MGATADCCSTDSHAEPSDITSKGPSSRSGPDSIETDFNASSGETESRALKDGSEAPSKVDRSKKPRTMTGAVSMLNLGGDTRRSTVALPAPSDDSLFGAFWSDDYDSKSDEIVLYINVGTKTDVLDCMGVGMVADLVLQRKFGYNEVGFAEDTFEVLRCDPLLHDNFNARVRSHLRITKEGLLEETKDSMINLRDVKLECLRLRKHDIPKYLDQDLGRYYCELSGTIPTDVTGDGQSTLQSDDEEISSAVETADFGVISEVPPKVCLFYNREMEAFNVCKYVENFYDLRRQKK